MRACPFCERPADSAEHLYPQWLSRYYTKRSPHGTFTMNMPESLGGTREVRILNQTVKVCADCNNGWMSRLEEGAGPLILKLMRDEAEMVQPAEQRLLGHWLFKMATLFELTQEDVRVSTPEARSMIVRGEVPSGWSAYLARAEPPHEWASYYRMGPIVTWTHDDGSLRGRMRLHTFRLGFMVTQVMVHSLEVDPTLDQLLGGPRFSVAIWPPQGQAIAWPPAAESLLPEWVEIVSGLNNPVGRQE